MAEYKLLITGPVGAGKTTAVAAISEVAPVVTDVQNNDATVGKDRTTVGLDFGELTLENGDTLRIFGTPGQARFDFMWDILAKGAIGLIILTDNSTLDPVADLELYLESFSVLIARTACVIGVGRSETHPVPSIDALSIAAQAKGVVCPILPIDARERDQVLMLVDLLLTQLESK